MSATSSSLDRRGFLASSAAVGAATLLPAAARAGAEGDAIRPFRIDVPEEQLVDLRRRVLATRWPDKETVGDRSQGTQLASLQELVASPTQIWICSSRSTAFIPATRSRW